MTSHSKFREECIRTGKARFIKELHSNKGNFTAAAAKTGVSRQCVYLWEKNDPEFLSKVIEVLKFLIKHKRGF